MQIHCDVSVKLPHQQFEWNGLLCSPDAKLQACTTIVWWSQFDCEKTLSGTTKHLSQCGAILLKHSLTSDLLTSEWLDKMKLSKWEARFKALLKRLTSKKEDTIVCGWQHWGETRLLHLPFLSLYGCDKLQVFCRIISIFTLQSKSLLYIRLTCAIHRIASAYIRSHKLQDTCYTNLNVWL